MDLKNVSCLISTSGHHWERDVSRQKPVPLDLWIRWLCSANQNAHPKHWIVFSAYTKWVVFFIVHCMKQSAMMAYISGQCILDCLPVSVSTDQSTVMTSLPTAAQIHINCISVPKIFRFQFVYLQSVLLPISTVGCDCSLRITLILIIIGVFFWLDSVIKNLVIKSTVILISLSKYYSWKILYGICVQLRVPIIKTTLTALLIKPKRLLNRLQAI